MTTATYSALRHAVHRQTGITVTLAHVAAAECELATTLLTLLERGAQAEAEKLLKDLLATHKTLANQNPLS